MRGILLKRRIGLFPRVDRFENSFLQDLSQVLGSKRKSMIQQLLFSPKVKMNNK